MLRGTPIDSSIQFNSTKLSKLREKTATVKDLRQKLLLSSSAISIKVRVENVDKDSETEREVFFFYNSFAATKFWLDQLMLQQLNKDYIQQLIIRSKNKKKLSSYIMALINYRSLQRDSRAQRQTQCQTPTRDRSNQSRIFNQKRNSSLSSLASLSPLPINNFRNFSPHRKFLSHSRTQNRLQKLLQSKVKVSLQAFCQPAHHINPPRLIFPSMWLEKQQLLLLILLILSVVVALLLVIFLSLLIYCY